MVTLSSLRRSVEAQQGTDGLDSAAVSAIAGSGVSVYETLDSLPATGLTAGDEAFVKSNNRLYVSNGSGWYNITLVNRNVRWDSGGEPDISYTITDSATPLIITARAIDSDNNNLINQSFVSDSAQYMVDISNDSSLFTFTPKSADSIGIEVSNGNLTDSNGDFTYTFKWSDGINFISKGVTITYNAGFAPLEYVNGGDRAFVFGGRQFPAVFNSTTGGNSVAYKSVQYFNATTPGNASTFGSLDAGSVNSADYPGSNDSWVSYPAGNMSNGTRALFGAGGNYQSLTGNDYIQYLTCATFSSVAIFGQLTRGGYGKAGASDGIKALMSDGGSRQQIDYVTIDTTGNANDFGDMQSYSSRGAGFSDGVKCVWNCGQGASSGYEYVTAATLSNAITFGNPVYGRYEAYCAHGNTTYGLTMGGDTSSTNVISSIEYITFATTGNASDWGSSLPQNRNKNAGTGNSNTAFSCGGEDGGSNDYTNNIYSISMDVVGNSASDFGDLSVNHQSGTGASGNAA